jgi:hypothetical protein
LNHFTVPLAITSSPQDQKINNGLPVPAKTGMSADARYAVCGTLDSLNDISILAENDHYRGAQADFARFGVI